MAKHVGIILCPDFALMSYSALTEPLRAANRLGASPPYETTVLGADKTPVVSSQGIAVWPDSDLGPSQKFHWLFVVAGGRPETFQDPKVFATLRSAARSGVVVGGVSGGPLILAKAGVMSGRRMTVHWEHADALREIAPDIALERSLFVIDRDRITCAGGTAPMDMMHHLIASDHGAPLARAVSDWFLHTEIRPSGGPQRAGLVERLGTANPALLEAVSVIEADPSNPPNLSALAARSGVSVRQLTRLFRDHLQTTPMGYARHSRLAVARRLIVQSPLALTEITYATGFANPSHFARCFLAEFGHPPSELRRARPRNT